MRLNPENVAGGIVNLSNFCRSLSLSLLFLARNRSVEGIQGLALLLFMPGFPATEIERKAVNESIVTAIQASICCHKKIHRICLGNVRQKLERWP